MTSHPETADYFFIRHAPVEKPSGVVPPANPPIKTQAYNLDPLIARLPKGALWHVSPLLRTRQTAAMLSERLEPAATPTPAPELVEMDFGEWHGQAVSDVWSKIATGPLHNWSFLTADRQPPGGENFLSQIERVRGWMTAQQKTFSPHPRIVMAHAGVLRAALVVALDADAEQAVGIPVPHFGILRLTLMEPARANSTGGCWQFVSLSDPNVTMR